MNSNRKRPSKKRATPTTTQARQEPEQEAGSSPALDWRSNFVSRPLGFRYGCDSGCQPQQAVNVGCAVVVGDKFRKLGAVVSVWPPAVGLRSRIRVSVFFLTLLRLGKINRLAAAASGAMFRGQRANTTFVLKQCKQFLHVFFASAKVHGIDAEPRFPLQLGG